MLAEDTKHKILYLDFIDFPIILIKINKLSEELSESGRWPQSDQTIKNLVSLMCAYVIYLC